MADNQGQRAKHGLHMSLGTVGKALSDGSTSISSRGSAGIRLFFKGVLVFFARYLCGLSRRFKLLLPSLQEKGRSTLKGIPYRGTGEQPTITIIPNAGSEIPAPGCVAILLGKHWLARIRK